MNMSVKGAGCEHVANYKAKEGTESLRIVCSNIVYVTNSNALRIKVKIKSKL